MTTCSCGYAPTVMENLADHLGEMFIPSHDADQSGQLHGETIPGRCLCGDIVASQAALDAHLLAAFTPPDHLGLDGRRHIPVGEAPEIAPVREGPQ
jgi:hypothetical protein